MHRIVRHRGVEGEAVHRTRLKSGRGWWVWWPRPPSRSISPTLPTTSGFPIGRKPARNSFNAFLGVPIVRSERTFGVLVVQNRVAAALRRRRGRGAADHRHGVGGNGGVGRVRRPFRASPRWRRGQAGRNCWWAGRFPKGVVIGVAVLHEPHAPLGRVIADDPVKEEARLELGIGSDASCACAAD